MNIVKMFFRDKIQQEVNVYKMHEVRWTSRYGPYSGDIKPEIRVFPTRLEADAFAEALRAAFELVKNTDHILVTVHTQEV
jgi:hypothetical protein